MVITNRLLAILISNTTNKSHHVKQYSQFCDVISLCWNTEFDEVGVAHSIVHFANDSDSEAVMSFMRFKDGKIILMETGATPLSDDYKLVGTEWISTSWFPPWGFNQGSIRDLM